MKVGKRSLLFGVHQFIWHPITVLIAWWELYGRPSWRELVCIVIHDWGYWFCPNMDGPEGEKHPEFGARIAWRLFGQAEYWDLCLLHSRHYARAYGANPSKLCWADKLSILYDPWWFYLTRAWLSGELKEYRKVAADAGFIPLSASNRAWFIWVQGRLAKVGREMRGDAVPYCNPPREGRGYVKTKQAPKG
jgi:hypothetical protein